MRTHRTGHTGSIRPAARNRPPKSHSAQQATPPPNRVQRPTVYRPASGALIPQTHRTARFVPPKAGRVLGSRRSAFFISGCFTSRHVAMDAPGWVNSRCGHFALLTPFSFQNHKSSPHHTLAALCTRSELCQTNEISDAHDLSENRISQGY